MISYVFIFVHVRIWPYRNNHSNIIKAAAEIQLFSVLLISLMMRFDDALLAREGFPLEYYKTLMCFLLGVVTPAPIIYTILAKDKFEEARTRISKESDDGLASKTGSSLALRKRSSSRLEIGDMEEADRQEFKNPLNAIADEERAEAAAAAAQAAAAAAQAAAQAQAAQAAAEEVADTTPLDNK